MKITGTLVGRVAVVLLIAATGSACGGKKAAEQQAPEASRQDARDPMEIEAAPALLKQLKLGQPELAAVAGSLRLSGRVDADEHRIATVSAPVTGKIIEMEVSEGQQVKRGQVLAVVRSTDLSGSQLAFLKAYSQQQLARRAVERAKLLLDAGVIGEAELQRRDAEQQQATAEVASSKDQLRVLGMPEDDVAKLESTRSITSLTQIVATIDGIVLERKATIGQVVQAADTCFVIADLSTVWLVADVPEQIAGDLEVGKQVEADISAFPGKPVHGRLSFVSSTVNPQTRTVLARMDVPNTNRKLKPNMLATIRLVDSSERLLVVPATAVVREGNADFLFVRKPGGENRFVLKPVTLGGEAAGDRRSVTQGLRIGEQIVVDGAFHLNNERRRLALTSSGGQ